MEIIKRLRDEDFRQFAEISANAYPGMVPQSAEDKQRMAENMIKAQKEDHSVCFYGLFRDGQLVGGMRIHDFKMRLHSVKVNAGGIGSVAVDLMHKKEKVAKGMVSYFLNYCRGKNMPIAALYPFRPDFYKKMGFGFGTKMNQYSIKPASLPSGSSKKNISFFEASDRGLLSDCYFRVAEKNNGMMDRTEFELNNILGSAQNRIVVYKRDGRIEGYILFKYNRASDVNTLKNDIFIKEILYENRDALMELMTFLNTQEDQINRVILHTQDENLHFMLKDPRNGTDNLLFPVYHESNVQGIGIMYRVVDARGLFGVMKNHNFNDQTIKLRINIVDSFLEENNGSVMVHFDKGAASIADNGDYEAEIRLDVADFSSLITGAVDFKSLLMYGLAEISDDKYAKTVNKLFEAEQKPKCFSIF